MHTVKSIVFKGYTINSYSIETFLVFAFWMIARRSRPEVFCKKVVLKGILRPILCIDINTHSDRKWKIMQNLFQKTMFSKCFNFFFHLFYSYHYILYFIFSDCMRTSCVYNMYRSSHRRCSLKKLFLKFY